MPQYHFQCASCGNHFTFTNKDSPGPCPTCGASPRRVFSFGVIRSMPEHYNHSIGEFVSNKRQFYDGLKRQSEAASIRTGIETDLQPVDPADMADMTAHGVTEEGLDETRRVNFTKD